MLQIVLWNPVSFTVFFASISFALIGSLTKMLFKIQGLIPTEAMGSDGKCFYFFKDVKSIYTWILQNIFYYCLLS